jgi:N-acetylmuramoyl-L-alanine amidase
MLSSLRSALLVCAALSASSVAPAQVGDGDEPLIASASTAIPKVVTPDPLAPLEEGVLADEPAPVDNIEDTIVEAPAPEKDLETLVAEMRGTDPGGRQLECLAVGIYFESKGEPLIGQLAVGEVIANRSTSGRFPTTYCGVLFQRGQFSFIRGKRLPSVPRSSRAWQTAVAIAKIVDQDLKDSAADDALFFHAKRVRPGWKRLKRVASIGNHIFYR